MEGRGRGHEGRRGEEERREKGMERVRPLP